MGQSSTFSDTFARLKQSPAWNKSFEAAGCAASGAVFGAALTAAGVHLPEVIIDQFKLSNFRMFEVFSVALGSSVIIIFALDRLGVAKKQVKPSTTVGWFSKYDGNILGGVLVGLGMSLSGSCPGTVTAQLGQGVSSAAVTALGGLAGGMAHIWHDSAQAKGKVTASATKPETITHATGISEPTLYAVIGGAWLSFLYYSLFFAAPGSVWRSATAGGLYLGTAQLISILATSSTLGASGIYDQAGRFALRLLGAKVDLPASPPRSLFFGAGAVIGSYALTRVLPEFTRISTAQLPWTTAFAGGFVMAYGAKIAKGCTSGHGLSGMGALSFPSLLSVASMFGTGILSQMFWR